MREERENLGSFFTLFSSTEKIIIHISTSLRRRHEYGKKGAQKFSVVLHDEAIYKDQAETKQRIKRVFIQDTLKFLNILRDGRR